MRVGNYLLAAVTAVSLISTPVLAASASPAAKLSVARSGSADKERSQAVGSGLIIGLVALAAIVGGVVIASDDNNNDAVSP